MKINITGFSLVELIVSVGILTIIAVFSLSSLSNNFERQNLANDIHQVSENIKELERNLSKSITDYEIYVLTGSFYYYKTNQKYQDITQNISFSSLTGSITTTDSIKNDLEVSAYFNDKKYSTKIFSSTGTYLINLEHPGKYRVDMSQVNHELGKIHIEHYSKNDIKKVIELVEIKDASHNSYTGIVIKNTLGGIKQYQSMTGAILTPPFEAHFEYKGIPLSLTLD